MVGEMVHNGVVDSLRVAQMHEHQRGCVVTT
jgi:hypothetical protein